MRARSDVLPREYRDGMEGRDFREYRKVLARPANHNPVFQNVELRAAAIFTGVAGFQRSAALSVIFTDFTLHNVRVTTASGIEVTMGIPTSPPVSLESVSRAIHVHAPSVERATGFTW